MHEMQWYCRGGNLPIFWWALLSILSYSSMEILLWSALGIFFKYDPLTRDIGFLYAGFFINPFKVIVWARGRKKRGLQTSIFFHCQSLGPRTVQSRCHLRCLISVAIQGLRGATSNGVEQASFRTSISASTSVQRQFIGPKAETSCWLNIHRHLNFICSGLVAGSEGQGRFSGTPGIASLI